YVCELGREITQIMLESYDADAVFQLDRYHIYQEISRKIRDKEAQEEIRELFEEEKIEDMLEYISIYADSVESDDKKIKQAKRRGSCISI
ncbi:MAG: hypothetical protein NC429_02820, partial [Lachnospiraceae bacterium]|nr:hypothetical protein [Lachnospiraceae bacterium]